MLVVYNHTKLQKLWWLGNWTTLFSNGFLKFYLILLGVEADARAAGGGEGATGARPSARAAAASSVRVGESPTTFVCKLDPSDTLLVYGVP